MAAVTGDGDGPDGGGGGGDCLRGGMRNANVFATVLMSKSAIVINERAYFQESGYLIRARTQKLWLADTVISKTQAGPVRSVEEELDQSKEQVRTNRF